jgi:hypothetical protein
MTVVVRKLAKELSAQKEAADGENKVDAQCLPHDIDIPWGMLVS